MFKPYNNMQTDKGAEVMEKVVIIINGNGGVGKDTMCGLAAEAFKVTNISSITPIKDIAARYGWNGEKDARSRKFLADLKKVFTEYNDLPTNYLVEEYRKFLESDSELLFVHIREGQEIDKFRRQVNTPCAALLIRRDHLKGRSWGNEADDNVAGYAYDFRYDNDRPLAQAGPDFIRFLQDMLDTVLKKDR